jgi:calcineurin-like phosphoesterase family protein
MDWYTSDEHYYHEGIIFPCGRPFKTTKQMNKTIIKNNNDVVAPDDNVHHVGDFTMLPIEDVRMIERILGQLNGIHHLILGNHDRQRPWDLIDAGFASVHTTLKMDYKGVNYFLHHDPAWSVVFNPEIQICGHVHNLFKVCRNVINVGVDVWNFKPVSFDQIKDIVITGVLR